MEKLVSVSILLILLNFFSCKNRSGMFSSFSSLVDDPISTYNEMDGDMPIFPVGPPKGKKSGVTPDAWAYPDMNLLKKFGPTGKVPMTVDGFVIIGGSAYYSSTARSYWQSACATWKNNIKKQFPKEQFVKAECGDSQKVQSGYHDKYGSIGKVTLMTELPKAYPIPSVLKTKVYSVGSLDLNKIQEVREKCQKDLTYYQSVFKARYLMGTCGFTLGEGGGTSLNAQLKLWLFPLYFAKSEYPLKFGLPLCSEVKNNLAASQQSLINKINQTQENLLAYVGGARHISSIAVSPAKQSSAYDGSTYYQYCATLSFEFNFDKVNELYRTFKNPIIKTPSLASLGEKSCAERVKYFQDFYGSRFIFGTCEREYKDSKFIPPSPLVKVWLKKEQKQRDVSDRVEIGFNVCGGGKSKSHAIDALTDNLKATESQVIKFVGGKQHISDLSTNTAKLVTKNDTTVYCANINFSLHLNKATTSHKALTNSMVIRANYLANSEAQTCEEDLQFYHNVFKSRFIYGTCEHQVKDQTPYHTEPSVKIWLKKEKDEGMQTHLFTLPVCSDLNKKKIALSSLNKRIKQAETEIINFVGGTSAIKSLSLAMVEPHVIKGQHAFCTAINFELILPSGDPKAMSLKSATIQNPLWLPVRDEDLCQKELTSLKKTYGNRYIYGSCELQFNKNTLTAANPAVKVWLQPSKSENKQKIKSLDFSVCGLPSVNSVQAETFLMEEVADLIPSLRESLPAGRQITNIKVGNPVRKSFSFTNLPTSYQYCNQVVIEYPENDSTRELNEFKNASQIRPKLFANRNQCDASLARITRQFPDSFWSRCTVAANQPIPLFQAEIWSPEGPTAELTSITNYVCTTSKHPRWVNLIEDFNQKWPTSLGKIETLHKDLEVYQVELNDLVTSYEGYYGYRFTLCGNLVTSFSIRDNPELTTKLQNKTIVYPSDSDLLKDLPCGEQLKNYEQFYGSRYILGLCGDRNEVWLSKSYQNYKRDEIELSLCTKYREDKNALVRLYQSTRNEIIKGVGGINHVDRMVLTGSEQIKYHHGDYFFNCGKLSAHLFLGENFQVTRHALDEEVTPDLFFGNAYVSWRENCDEELSKLQKQHGSNLVAFSCGWPTVRTTNENVRSSGFYWLKKSI